MLSGSCPLSKFINTFEICVEARYFDVVPKCIYGISILVLPILIIFWLQLRWAVKNPLKTTSWTHAIEIWTIHFSQIKPAINYFVKYSKMFRGHFFLIGHNAHNYFILQGGIGDWKHISAQFMKLMPIVCWVFFFFYCYNSHTLA